jgi:hypothetical protein
MVCVIMGTTSLKGRGAMDRIGGLMRMIIEEILWMVGRNEGVSLIEYF